MKKIISVKSRVPLDQSDFLDTLDFRKKVSARLRNEFRIQLWAIDLHLISSFCIDFSEDFVIGLSTRFRSCQSLSTCLFLTLFSLWLACWSQWKRSPGSDQLDDLFEQTNIGKICSRSNGYILNSANGTFANHGWKHYRINEKIH